MESQSITQEDLTRMMVAKMRRSERVAASPCAFRRRSSRLASRMLKSHLERIMYPGGVDPSHYQEEIANISQLFEPSSSYILGQDIFIVFREIEHTFRSLREVANAFNIPLAAPAVETHVPPSLPAPLLPPAPPPSAPKPSASDLLSSYSGPAAAPAAVMARPRPAELTAGTMQVPARVNTKGNGRVGSQFQDLNLVDEIQKHIGMEVTCGDLRAKLASCDLGGLLFELLDANGRGTGKLYPTSRLAKLSNLAHQNNSWKSIKVPVGPNGTLHTLDFWVTMIRSKLYKDDDGLNECPEDKPIQKKRRRNSSRNFSEDSGEEDQQEEVDNRSDDHQSRQLQGKRKVAQDHSQSEVARLTEENRSLRQRVQMLERIIQKAQASTAALMSQLHEQPGSRI